MRLVSVLRYIDLSIRRSPGNVTFPTLSFCAIRMCQAWLEEPCRWLLFEAWCDSTVWKYSHWQSPNCYSSKYLTDIKCLLLSALPKEFTLWRAFCYVVSSVSLSQEKICFATPVVSERTQECEEQGCLGSILSRIWWIPWLIQELLDALEKKGIQTGSRSSANNLVLLSIFQSKCPKRMTFLSAFQGVGSSIPRQHTWLSPVYPTVSLGLDPLCHPSSTQEIQISLMATV